MTDKGVLIRLSDMYHEERTRNYRENLKHAQERSRIIDEIVKRHKVPEKQESYHAYIARRYKEVEEITNDK